MADRSVFQKWMEECVAELSAADGPTPAVSASTRALRRVRAEQLDEVHRVLEAGSALRHGYRSPTDWLVHTTGEAVGHCRTTLHLAARIQHMPVVKAAFGRGEVAETALRLLADAWSDATADLFARDEEMLAGWATSMPHRDFKMVLDAWRMHADAEREELTAADRFDARALHVSELLDGMGRLDGTLDPEGLKLVQEALRAFSAPADGDTRTAAQRRADALVSIARMAIDTHVPAPGRKRRRPKVIATIDYADLVARTGGGTIDTDAGRITATADAIRRLACDAGVHRYVSGAPDARVHFGRQTRTVSDSLFDTLLIRDHGCRWPGCTIPAGACDAHHATHWLDLGETEPDNLVLLCWHHHHLLHEQHWSIEPLGAGHFQLSDPYGGIHPMRPPLVGLALPTEPPQPALPIPMPMPMPMPMPSTA